MNLTKVASLLLIITAIFTLLILGERLIVPFIIALLIWYLINALAHWIANLKIGKKHLPQWATLIISTFIIALVLLFVGGLIAENARGMISELPKYEKNVGNIIERLGRMFNFNTDQYFKISGTQKVPDIFGNVNKMLENVNLGTLITNLLNTLSAIAGNAFLIIIYVLFLLFEQAVFPKKIKALFPDKERFKKVQQILDDINDAIRAYFKVKLTVSVVTGFASYLLMAYIGLDFAVFWAFLIFLLNFIPNIGSLVATLFPAALALIQFDNSFTPFFAILLGVGAIQLLVGNFLEPRMMGSSLNISSLVVIIALTLWGTIWGITGMILSVPITVILMIIFAQFESTRPIAILLSENGELMNKLEIIEHAND